MEITASLSRVLGFLRILRDLGGKVDVARIPDESGMHADEVLPLLDFSEALDLIRVANGDVELTESGSEFLRGSHDFRAKYLRGKLMKLSSFKEIMGELKRRGCIKKEDALKIIVKEEVFHYFSPEEAFNCLIHWGVYSGLVEYDREERLVRLGAHDP